MLAVEDALASDGILLCISQKDAEKKRCRLETCIDMVQLQNSTGCQMPDKSMKVLIEGTIELRLCVWIENVKISHFGDLHRKA